VTRRAYAALVVAAALAACGETYDGGGDIDGYWNWNGRTPYITTHGDTPGHGDTIRLIYVNEKAREFRGGKYEVGSIVVKEVRERKVNGGAGRLEVLEVMRRIGTDDVLYDTEGGGWLFTAAPEPGGPETIKTDFCWRRCHVNAPFAGAWFDYGQPQAETP
jgi:hypothetical protein